MATHGRETPEPPYAHANRGYWTDGEDSQRAPSERTLSEYTVSFTLKISLTFSYSVFSVFQIFFKIFFFCVI